MTDHDHHRQTPHDHNVRWNAWTWWNPQGEPVCIEVARDEQGTLHFQIDGVKADRYPEGFTPPEEWSLNPPRPHTRSPSRADHVRAWQRIVGGPQTGHYEVGDETFRLTAEWQAKHLPDLPELHRGYLHNRNWVKAAELGHCTEACTCDAPEFDHPHQHDCAVHWHRIDREPEYAAAEKAGHHKAIRQARHDERRLRRLA